MSGETFKFVVSDPTTRKAYQIEVEKERAAGVLGLRIGDVVDGGFLGLPGYKLKITGGTDRDGFPMHRDVEGPGRKRLLLSGPPCFHPRVKGERRRKLVRGNTISEDIAQINCKVVEYGEKPLEELIPKKEEKEGGEKG